MRSVQSLLCISILLFLLINRASRIDAQQADPNSSGTIRVTSRLVFLDVTVVDRNGHPVVKGLSKDDFTITDDKKPERIFSFEPPESHTTDSYETSGNGYSGISASKPPVTIFVLDLLDSSFSDFAYIRYTVRKYLAAQPAQLKSPAELMVLGNQSLEMVQGFTQSKAELLYALDHVPQALPYKEMHGFVAERFAQSIDALQQVALQNKGVPGRKNIIWVGHGGPSLLLIGRPDPQRDMLNRYVHDTTNMLVDSRVSLFLIYPGLEIGGGGFNWSELSANAEIGDDDPFSGDINFGVFVNETGGKLFYDRNDVSNEIKQSEELGSKYYTLTYQPQAADADGKFRHIQVTLRDPNLRALTKEGYFSLDKNESAVPQQERTVDVSEAARSSIPFDAIGVTITDVLRHPDTNTAQFTVVLSSKNLHWHPTVDGKSRVDVLLAAVSLNGSNDFLASKMQGFTATADNQDPAKLAEAVTRIPITLKIPHDTQTIRVAVQLSENGKTGTAELTRKALAAAPQAPTPEPKLMMPSQRPSMPAGLTQP